MRWRLARLIAGVPILRDPVPSEGGVVIMYRENGVEWAIRATRFRLKSTTRLPSFDYGKGDHAFRPVKTFTRFVGTVE